MNSTPIFFTADEHYGHENIIRYCDRPFTSVDEMDAEIIRRHNEMVGSKDVVIHAGDFYNATINQPTDAKLNQAIDSHGGQHNTPQKEGLPRLALMNNTPPAAT